MVPHVSCNALSSYKEWFTLVPPCIIMYNTITTKDFYDTWICLEDLSDHVDGEGCYCALDLVSLSPLNSRSNVQR